MQASNRAVITAVLAALVAAAGVLGDVTVAGRGQSVLAGLLAVLALVFAVGWPVVAGLPNRIGSTVVVALGGGAAAATVYLTRSEPLLGDVPVVFAMVVLLAFGAELLRRDGRDRLVESVSGTVAGALVPVCAAGWLAAARTGAGDELVVLGAGALAVGSAVSALSMTGWLRAMVTMVVTCGAGAGVGTVLDGVGLRSGVLLGLAVGVLVAAASELFTRLPALDKRAAGWAVAVLPVAVTGILVYVVGRVLIG